MSAIETILAKAWHDVMQSARRQAGQDMTAWEDMSDGQRRNVCRLAAAGIAALSAAGYVIVPLKPTEAMIDAAYNREGSGMGDIWDAMLAAAQEQPK